ncbi:MAG: cytochrome c biogenesis protein ResB [Oligoflexia bacterium]|nr:cytochrome c biogenesis protein ResB [Oligoflexia bacterium]
MFKFLSSVKLAVPLMLVLGFCVAIGTIIESRYNAEYARMLIYQTSWFYALLGLLWVNIFCATLSRWPFKIHHTGFVITHIGLLTLLIGAFVTAKFGIDGQLIVSEGEENNKVLLPETIIQLQNVTTNQFKTFEIPRGPTKKELNLSISDFLTAKTYLPFSQTQDVYEKATEGDGALKFSIKSPFFNLTQWLHEKDNPEIQMGPATFKLKTSKVATQKEPVLLIFNATTSKLLAQKTLREMQQSSFKVNNVTVKLLRAYKSATVDKSKITEGKNASPNPALELLLEHDGKSIREISYAKFPDFSLNNTTSFNLRLHYIYPNHDQEIAPGNIVEFEMGPPIVVSLYKNKKLEEKKSVQVNEVYQTPWMGIQITVLEAFKKSLKKTLVTQAPLIERAPLPAPAILFNFKFSDTDESIWLTHNQTQDFKLGNEVYSLFYGAKSILLPFNIFLNKFEKIDYPGTQTPKSFQSTVNEKVVISMNEPLKKEGYTLYQASYILQEGMAPASVFSVNKDPGRPIKYLGSTILSIGIIVFTVMRSRLYKNWKKRKA